MLVLDKQLLGRNIEVKLARWYRGSILFIMDLRPDTIIKDEAISAILRQQSSPTFVTINEADFWRKVPIDRHFCAVCFPLPDSQVAAIPELLRSMFRHHLFRTKAQRMGKVVRVTQGLSAITPIVIDKFESSRDRSNRVKS
jgi:hypothetical protein